MLLPQNTVVTKHNKVSAAWVPLQQLLERGERVELGVHGARPGARGLHHVRAGRRALAARAHLLLLACTHTHYYTGPA